MSENDMTVNERGLTKTEMSTTRSLETPRTVRSEFRTPAGLEDLSAGVVPEGWKMVVAAREYIMSLGNRVANLKHVL